VSEANREHLQCRERAQNEREARIASEGTIPSPECSRSLCKNAHPSVDKAKPRQTLLWMIARRGRKYRSKPRPHTFVCWGSERSGEPLLLCRISARAGLRGAENRWKLCRSSSRRA